MSLPQQADMEISGAVFNTMKNGMDSIGLGEFGGRRGQAAGASRNRVPKKDLSSIPTTSLPFSAVAEWGTHWGPIKV
jgi:hypothetical protein